MMWLVWVIGIGVVASVGGAVIVRWRKDHLDLTMLFLVVMVLIYVTGLILGPAITFFSSPTLADWKDMLEVRVAWEIAGAVAIVLGVLASAIKGGTVGKPAVWILAAVLAGISVWVAQNPLDDLEEGPVTLRAEGLTTKTWSDMRGGRGISAKLRLRATDGSSRTLPMIGWSATDAEDRLRSCRGKTQVAVTLLKHIGRVIDVRCQ